MSAFSWFVAATCGLVFVDQLLKATMPLVGLNSRGPFSLPVPNLIVLLSAAVLLLGLMGWYGRQRRGVLIWLSACFLFAGGLSNTIDRIFKGGVRDIAAWGLVETNMADILVILGLIILVGSVFKKTDWDTPK